MKLEATLIKESKKEIIETNSKNILGKYSILDYRISGMSGIFRTIKYFDNKGIFLSEKCFPYENEENTFNFDEIYEKGMEDKILSGELKIIHKDKNTNTIKN